MVNNALNKIFFLFLLSHLLIWVIVPSVSNNNLPRDTIEALAWASNLEWGFEKHPPFSAFVAEIFYKIFGNQDWAYYLLSQLFILVSFLAVWELSKDFFKNKKYSLISIFLLEGVYFYNYTTPEFNVNVCQIPFWALTVLFAWRGFKFNKVLDWILFGLFAGLGILSKYLFIYLLITISIFLFYMVFLKKLNLRFLISAIPFLLILSPHILWLAENNYITISYGLHRSTSDFYSGDQDIFNHIKYPLVFIFKQIGILIPFSILSFLAISKFQIKLNLKDKKLIFLIFINLVPLFLILLTSLLFGINIRTMWMTPFYLFFGVFLIFLFQKNINLTKMKYFYYVFIFLFLLSPSFYLVNSIFNKDQRIDYPAKEISIEVQDIWNKNFRNDIDIVIGQAWWAGNLSYHLDNRPKFIRGYLNFVNEKLDPKYGVVYIESENSKLKKTCPGVSFITNSRYICMVGIK